MSESSHVSSSAPSACWRRTCSSSRTLCSARFAREFSSFNFNSTKTRSFSQSSWPVSWRTTIEEQVFSEGPRMNDLLLSSFWDQCCLHSREPQLVILCYLQEGKARREIYVLIGSLYIPGFRISSFGCPARQEVPFGIQNHVDQFV